MATITARAGPRTKATSPLSPGGPRRRDPPVPQPRFGADRRDGPLAQAAAEQRTAPARDRRPATRRSCPSPEVLDNVQNVAGFTPAQAAAEGTTGVTAENGQVGNLGLTASQEADLVNFLKILSDGYTKPNPAFGGN